MANSADPEKPTELDLHCLLRQDMSCSVREGLSLFKNCCTKMLHMQFGVAVLEKNFLGQ